MKGKVFSMTDLIDYMKKFGPWAVLFVLLLVYVLTDAKNRELKYQEMLIQNHQVIEKMTSMYDMKLTSIEAKIDKLK